MVVAFDDGALTNYVVENCMEIINKFYSSTREMAGMASTVFLKHVSGTDYHQRHHDTE